MRPGAIGDRVVVVAAEVRGAQPGDSHQMAGWRGRTFLVAVGPGGAGGGRGGPGTRTGAVRGPESVRPAGALLSPLISGGRDCQAVHQVVHRVAAVPLDPPKRIRCGSAR